LYVRATSADVVRCIRMTMSLRQNIFLRQKPSLRQRHFLRVAKSSDHAFFSSNITWLIVCRRNHSYDQLDQPDILKSCVYRNQKHMYVCKYVCMFNLRNSVGPSPFRQ
jgi:hypothetical protein